VKRLLPALLLLTAGAVLADEKTPAPPTLNPKAEKIVNASLPVCSGEMTVQRLAMAHKLPSNMTGVVIRAESDRNGCKGQWLSISTNEGDHYFGMPWFLDEEKAPTIEEKLKHFTWENMKQNFDVKVDRSRKTRDGLYPATLTQLFENGKVPMEGEVDPDGKFFFMGHFQPLAADAVDERLKALAPYLPTAPSEGSATAKVTVIEFSDFECPSCKNAAAFVDPIVKKYGGNDVRYVRYDLPLMMLHPWAFSAAVAGRAIYRQKPEAFWSYKKTVYDNQDKLTTFAIDEFARNFAQDHDLDIKKYDADVDSPEVRNEILSAEGPAFANGVNGTPTYLINGRIVDPGFEGKALDSYVGKLLGK
jgi:protein-disulfide isomerase